MYGEDIGVSCITGFPGTANPVAKEYFESAPIPTSDVADDGRRLCRPAYMLLRRLPNDSDRLGPKACGVEGLPSFSKLACCDRVRCVCWGCRGSLVSSSESCKAPYDEPAGDERRRGARDMKARKRWATVPFTSGRMSFESRFSLSPPSEYESVFSAGSHLRLGEGQDSFRVRSGILVVVVGGVIEY